VINEDRALAHCGRRRFEHFAHVAIVADASKHDVGALGC